MGVLSSFRQLSALRSKFGYFTIYALIFLLSRIPFIICPIIGFYGDAADYHSVSYQFHLGDFPAFTWLPPGYILFLHFMNELFNSALLIVIVQNIITFISFGFFLISIFKYFNQLRLIALIGVSICLFNVQNLEYDTSILTESLYCNSLIVLCSLALHIFNESCHWKYYILTSLFLIIPSIIRMNGIVLFPLLAVLIYLLYKQKRASVYYLSLILPFISVWILWSTYNFATQKIFFIGYPTEILRNFNSLPKKPLSQAQIDSTNHFKENHPLSDYFGIPDDFDTTKKVKVSYPLGRTRLENYLWFYKNITDRTPWFSCLNKRYKALYIGKWSESQNPFWGFDNFEYRTYVFKEWIHPPQKEGVKFLSIKTNLIFKIYDYIYFKVFAPLTRNILVVISFFILFLYASTSLFWTKLRSIETKFVLFIGSVLLLHSFIYISPTANALTRYTYPTEFIYYMCLIFSPAFLFKKYRHASK